MDRLSDLLIDFEDAPDLVTLRGLAGQRVILIGFDKARSHGVATALARLKCLTRTVSYTEVYPENPDLALADVVVLHWSDEIKGSAWDRPGFVSGHWPSTSPPLIIAGQRQAMNAVPLPAPSAQFDFFELGDDSTIVRAIQECLVKMDDKNSGPSAEAAIRVLAIDDDPEMRQLIRTLLDSLGFQSFFAYDGRPGVKMARRIMPNLILLDINMPGANGFDVLSAIRQEPGTSPAMVMLLSSSSSEADIRMSCSLKADGYVTKPFSALNLATRLRNITAGCRSVEPRPLRTVQLPLSR